VDRVDQDGPGEWDESDGSGEWMDRVDRVDRMDRDG
jgi:hypothetical protein